MSARRGRPGYSRAYFERVSPRESTPEEISERLLHHKAAAIHNRELEERMKRYSAGDIANGSAGRDLVAWSARRLLEIKNELKGAEGPGR